jgi:hypothetical protein
MKTVPLLLAIALLAAGAAAFGQTSTIQGPGGGFVFDASTHSVRALIGMPGASYLGAPVVSGVALAAVAPDGKKALVAGADGVELISDLNSPSASRRRLPDVITNPDRLLWSADAASAVVFSAAAKQLQFLQDAGAGFTPGRPCDLSSLPPDLVLLAAEASAGIAAVGAVSEGKLTVYLVREAAAPRSAIVIGSPVAPAVFGDNGTVLYVADPASSSLWILRNLDGDIQAGTLFEFPGAWKEPVALALDAGGKFLYAADAGRRSLQVYDLESRRPGAELELDGPPSSLEPFSPSAFLLNARRQGREPILLLQTSPKLGIFFIPSGE